MSCQTFYIDFIKLYVSNHCSGNVSELCLNKITILKSLLNFIEEALCIPLPGYSVCMLFISSKRIGSFYLNLPTLIQVSIVNDLVNEKLVNDFINLIT